MSLGGGLMHLVTEFLALKSRRIIRQAALGLAAGLLVVAFLGITLTFACIGLFLALEPSLGGPGAALVVAGISLVLALVILLAIFVAMRRRRPRRRPGPVPATPAAGPGAPPQTPGSTPGRRSVPVAAASGFLTGFLTGRATEKTPPRR
jgi:Na+-transporting methylmalonyl-CoA/oxaloacetate decarboxylase gamma subunit